MRSVWKTPRRAAPWVVGGLLCGLGLTLAGCGKSRSQAEAEQVASLADQLVACQNERDALRERLARTGARPGAAPTAADPKPSGPPSAAALSERLATCDGQRQALSTLVAAAEKAAPPSAAGPAAVAHAGPAGAVGSLRAPGGGPSADDAQAAAHAKADATRQGVAQLASPLRAAGALDPSALSAAGQAGAAGMGDLKGQGRQGQVAASGALEHVGPRAGRQPPLGGDPPRSLTPTPRRSRPADPAAEANAAQASAQVFRDHAGQLKACYERGLKRNDQLQFVSRVQVRLTITPEGRARGVTLQPRVDPELEACIGRAMAHWPFPHFNGSPVMLEVPLGLRALGG